MTQGLVSFVTQKGDVLMKIVAGSNGMKAQSVADIIKDEWPVTPERAKEISEEEHFGSEDDLVIMTDSQILAEDPASLGSLYAETFENPNFNPRWEKGILDHVVVVTV